MSRLKTVNNKLYLVLGCVHLPYHSKKAFRAMCRMVEDLDLHGIILNGDCFDLNSITRHNRGFKNKGGLTLESEYAKCVKPLKMLHDAAGDVKEKHFLYGNHEKWWYSWAGSTEVSKLGDISHLEPWKNQLEKYGYIPQFNYETASIELGNLLVYHGFTVGQTAAKSALQKMNRSIFFNHTHRQSSHVTGENRAYNGGMMIDKDSPAFDYCTVETKQDWSIAFSLVTVAPNGAFHVDTKTYDKGFFHNGVYYK